jgi:uncharacterized membrane protein YecN with MAPEG domain
MSNLDSTAFLALITAAALLVYVWTAFNVGRARGKYGIQPPATAGHPDFDRVYRVQMNTLEQLVFFLPSLWLFGLYVSPLWGACLGVVWVVGRIFYARGYYRATERRGLGFMVAFFASVILLLGGIVGIVLALVA